MPAITNAAIGRIDRHAARFARPPKKRHGFSGFGGGSSNGRTADSDSASLGSNPSPPASSINKIEGEYAGRLSRVSAPCRHRSQNRLVEAAKAVEPEDIGLAGCRASRRRSDRCSTVEQTPVAGTQVSRYGLRRVFSTSSNSEPVARQAGTDL
jgi:hypothetical protein